MATAEDPLSLETQEKVNHLKQLLRRREVELLQDSAGKLHIVYTNEKTERGQNSSDVRRMQVEDFVKTTSTIKQARAPPLGVVLDESKIGVGPFGRYTEDKQFERLGEVLGTGKFAGDVEVVRDNKSGTEHALKKVTISQFSGNEVLAWVDLGDSDTFPSLYMVRLDDNKIAFHMEIIKHGVTLDGIINSHMTNLLQNAPELMRPFSLFIFHGLLRAVAEMHEKNWAHCDLHGGNVMVTKDPMMLKVLDFGRAQPLRGKSDHDHDSLKDDILKALRLFCGVYTGQDFLDILTLERKIEDGTLMKKVLSETPHLSESEQDELHQLIMKTYDVIRHQEQADYGSTAPVMEQIEDKIYREKMEDLIAQVPATLFRDTYRRDINLDRGQQVVDGAGAMEQQTGEAADNPPQDKEAVVVPEVLLQGLDIHECE